MRKLSYISEVVIERPSEEVFDFCSDLRNELVWNPNATSVAKLTEGPVGVGTRYRAQWSNTGPIVVEITQLDRPLTWETRSRARGLEVRFQGAVEAEATGSRYTVRLQLRPAGLAWLYAPIALLAMKRQERENMERIKRVLESRPPPG